MPEPTTTNGAPRALVILPHTEWRSVPLTRARVITTVTPEGILLRWKKDAYHVVSHFTHVEDMEYACRALNQADNTLRMLNTLSHFLHTTKASQESWDAAKRIVRRTQSLLRAAGDTTP